MKIFFSFVLAVFADVVLLFDIKYFGIQNVMQNILRMDLF